MTCSSTFKHFNHSHINSSLFQDILKGFNPDARLKSWRRSDVAMNHGYNTSPGVVLTQGNNDRFLGINAFNISFEVGDTKAVLEKTIVLKSKLTGKESFDSVMFLTFAADDNDKRHWEKYWLYYNFHKTDFVELSSYSTLAKTGINKVMPEIYWSWMDKDKDIFVLAMEYFNSKEFTKIGATPGGSEWSQTDIESVLNGMAVFHAHYLGKTSDVPQDLLYHITEKPGKFSAEHQHSCELLIDRAEEMDPEFWSEECYETLKQLLNNLEKIFKVLNVSPKTLIHYDMSTRNICMRDRATSNKHRLCLYDWEATSIGPLQIDIAHFLSEVMSENSTAKNWHQYLKVYIHYLIEELGESIPEEISGFLKWEEFLGVFNACLAERMVHHIGVQCGYYNTTVPLKWAGDTVRVAAKYMKETSGCHGLLG